MTSPSPSPSPGPSRRLAQPLLLVLLPLVLVVAACGATGGGNGHGGTAKGCGKCTSQLADLRSAVAKVPGVTSVLDVRYTEAVQLTTPATVTVVVQGTDGETLRTAITEQAWRSDVQPLSQVSIGIRAGSGGHPTYATVDLEQQSSSFTKRWGARPTGG